MAAASASKFWAVLQNLCLSDISAKPEHLSHLIKVLKEQRPLKDKENSKEFAQKIKKWFSSSEERWIVLCLMPIFLKDFDAEILWQNTSFWMKSLMQILSSKPSPPILNLTLRCIPKLLKISVEFDDLCREFSLNLIQPLVTSLNQQICTDSKIMEERLPIYRQCIIYYPGPMGRFRSQIEAHCLSLLSNTDDFLRQQACRCLAVLPRCGSSGEKGSKFAEFWSKQFTMIMNTLSELLDSLFHITADHNTNKENRKTLMKHLNVPSAEPSHSIILSSQIRSLLFIIEEMLSYEFPNILNINLQAIIALVFKIFLKNVEMGKSSIESVCINAVLPHLWCACLSLLNTLVMQIGTLILPFEATVSQMIYQALSFAHNDGKALFKEHPNIRICTYQLMINWSAKIVPLNAEFISRVIDFVLSDIEPEVLVEKSAALKSNEKQKKQKHGKKFQDDIIENEMAGKNLNQSEGSDVACLALKLLETFINVSGPLITLDTVSKIQNMIVSLCIKVSEPSKQISKNFQPPYNHVDSRKLLLGCVFSLINLYHHQLPTLLSSYISIFKSFMNDPSDIVSTASKNYLCLCDKILHPSVPALRTYQEVKNVEKQQQNSFGNINSATFSGGLLDGFEQYSTMLNSQQMNASESKSLLQKESTENLADEVIDTNIICIPGDTVPTQSEPALASEPEPVLERVPENIGNLCIDNTDLSVKYDVAEGSFNEAENPALLPAKKSFEKIPETIVLQNRKDMKETGNQDGFETDDSEISLKRPRLDVDANEMGNKAADKTEQENFDFGNVEQIENEEKIKRVLSDTEEKKDDKVVNMEEDETSMFLQAFVNSYPDSE